MIPTLLQAHYGATGPSLSTSVTKYWAKHRDGINACKSTHIYKTHITLQSLITEKITFHQESKRQSKISCVHLSSALWIWLISLDHTASAAAAAAAAAAVSGPKQSKGTHLLCNGQLTSVCKLCKDTSIHKSLWCCTAQSLSLSLPLSLSLSLSLSLNLLNCSRLLKEVARCLQPINSLFQVPLPPTSLQFPNNPRLFFSVCLSLSNQRLNLWRIIMH